MTEKKLANTLRQTINDIKLIQTDQPALFIEHVRDNEISYLAQMWMVRNEMGWHLAAYAHYQTLCEAAQVYMATEGDEGIFIVFTEYNELCSAAEEALKHSGRKNFHLLYGWHHAERAKALGLDICIH